MRRSGAAFASAAFCGAGSALLRRANAMLEPRPVDLDGRMSNPGQRMGFAPGTRLVSLDPDILGDVFDHPQQHDTLRKIAQYVVELRACSQTQDFVELQRRLLHDAHRVDNRRAECVQSAKRVEAGKTPHGDVAPPHAGGVHDRVAWQKEALVHERLFRQFRSIATPWPGASSLTTGRSSQLLPVIHRRAGS